MKLVIKELHIHLSPSGEILAAITSLKGTIMSALEDLQTKVDSLAATAEASNAKADTLITLVGSLKQQIADLQAAGGATPDQLAALGTQIQGVEDSLRAQISEDDAAAGTAGEPPPAP